MDFFNFRPSIHIENKPPMADPPPQTAAAAMPEPALPPPVISDPPARWYELWEVKTGLAALVAGILTWA